ncbi:PGAP1-like domain protein [Leptospira inadai serovar Lyme str. 10]|uniref:PGAP1-like domain protein n=2 Tax=Leptospira inadai serovar Lyme TaxID=293084 RepID=V6HCJ5_9LEPT|nr:PGAP1-like domain protein [Leptospira inadai serovar Lyme str. 10]PNV72804.1 hypothetical protein BES34_018730 [Leptospira inadai serovar Lyme]
MFGSAFVRNLPALLLFLFSFSYCHVNDLKARLSPHTHKSNQDKLLNYILFEYYTETNHALYRYINILSPVAATKSQINADFFGDPSIGQVAGKTKLIFIHGWDFTERNTDPPTDKYKKVSNLLGTWNQALEFVDNNISNVYTNYEIYVFTYRTSDYISNNGRRLIDTLNANFSPSDKVILLAHSMGGLVSRAALYHPDNTKDIIHNIVSLGTPYYGSPFASPQYQNNDLSAIGSIVGFVTGTPGGKDLGYTNGGTLGSNLLPGEYISNSYNGYLESLLGQMSKDSKVSVYYGNLAGSCSGHDIIYASGCTILNSTTPQFPNTDGIVTTYSGQMYHNPVAGRFSQAGFDHSQMSFRNPANPSNIAAAQAFFTTVITYINGL